MRVLSPRARLPDFDQGFAYRTSLLVRDSPRYDDRLTLSARTARREAGQVVVSRTDKAQVEKRPDGLGRGNDRNRFVRGSRLVYTVAANALETFLVHEYRGMGEEFLFTHCSVPVSSPWRLYLGSPSPSEGS